MLPQEVFPISDERGGPWYLSDLQIDPSINGDNSYYSSLPVVQNLIAMGGLTFQKPVTFFVGENGTGKSTLLEGLAIASGFNPEGGSVNFNFASRDTHAALHRHLRLSRRGVHRPKDGFFLRAESFYNVATEVERLYENEPIPSFYGGKSLHQQSHGESFLSLVAKRFGGNGLYILDEPEAALSPSRQMALLTLIHHLVQRRSQFIISTHSPILLAYPDADIFQLTDESIALTPYEDTETYRVYKTFLDAPGRMLRHLLDE